MSDDNVFPVSTKSNTLPQSWILSGGLTKRELFAAMAMQGLATQLFENGEVIRAVAIEQGEKPTKTVACMAINIADALLAELAKTGESK